MGKEPETCKKNCERVKYCSIQYKGGCNNEQWKEDNIKTYKELLEMITYERKEQ